MNDSNARLFVLAQAEQARVMGMQADNAVRQAKGEYPIYEQCDFEHSANLIDGFAREME